MYFTIFAPVFAFVAAFTSSFSTSMVSSSSPPTTASTHSSAVALTSPSFSSPPPEDWHVKRSVWSPRITSPMADDVWRHGEIRNVTWNTSDAPAHISNRFSIRLGYGGKISHLFLARDFEPRRGWVEVTVPWVREHNYTVILFGDSGSVSPAFTILE